MGPGDLSGSSQVRTICYCTKYENHEQEPVYELQSLGPPGTYLIVPIPMYLFNRLFNCQATIVYTYGTQYNVLFCVYAAKRFIQTN